MSLPRTRPATLLAALALAAVALVTLVSSGSSAKTPKRFPTPTSAGVPKGWKPVQTRSTDLVVKKAGTTVKDLLLTGGAGIIVDAPNVTIRRVKLQGGRITNYAGPRCVGRMTIEDTTIEPPAGASSTVETEGVIDAAAYTARRVKIWRRSEGFRLTGNGYPGCDPIRIQDSFIKIVIPEGRCDLHADGIQGYGGPHTSVVNVTIDFTEATCGTAPFFVPKDQDNTTVTVKRLLVMGGGYPFRLGVAGTVTGLKIVNRSWEFGPIDVACSLLRKWEANIVTITSNYQVKKTLRAQRCNTENGE